MGEDFEKLRERIFELCRQSREDEALETLSEFVGISNFTLKDILDLKIYVYTSKKEFALALSFASEMVRMCPNSAGSHYRRGKLQFLNDKFEDAIVDFEEVVRLERESGSAAFVDAAYYWLALCNINLKRFNAAKRYVDLMRDEHAEYMFGRLVTVDEIKKRILPQ